MTAWNPKHIMKVGETMDFREFIEERIHKKKLSTLRNQGAFLMPKIDRSEVVKLRVE